MTSSEPRPMSAYPFLAALKRLLIGGEWVAAASGRTFDTVNPSNGKVLAQLPLGEAEDIARAVAAARRAFEGAWSGFRPYERQELLLKLADLVDANYDELSLLDTLDMGAPISRTRGMKTRAVGRLRFYAGLATAIHGDTIWNSRPGELFSYTRKEPVGVVGAIIPWNGPIGAAVWKLGPALATGCTVVMKPAEEASLSTLRLGELLLEAGTPEGVVNIVTGFGEGAGAALTAHPDVDKIAFTGSHFTGQKIVHASAGNLKRLSLELGGKSPNIVFSDADLDAAVPGAAMGVFSNSGQICSAGTRLFVERRIHDEFVERVRAFSEKLRLGDGSDPETEIGPLVSVTQMQRVSQYLDAGKEDGARAILGGEPITSGALADGFFIPPTMFDGVHDDMRICREEIFGPVMSIVTFEDEDEAVRRANDTMFGLAAGVWTRDVGKAHRMSARVKAGTVWVNCYHALDPAVPFGGNKMSGYGRESGADHLNEFLSVKSVWMNTK